jgi:16S rRNA pseudouridine516 synthase
MRVDRLLANLGYGSRREVQSLVADGRVTLDEEMLDNPEARLPITPDLSARMSVAGEPLDPPPGHLTLVLHKPLGFVCSHKEGGRLVYELFPARWRRREPPLSSVGRLDKDTSGLLLFTDDGDFLHRVISPKKRLPKVYRASLARPLNGSEAELFASGTLLLEGESKPLQPARLDILSSRDARLTITEGRYHQVRRMFAAVGNHVVSLHRERVGTLDLPDDFGPGAWRLLGPPELSAMLKPAEDSERLTS